MRQAPLEKLRGYVDYRGWAGRLPGAWCFDRSSWINQPWKFLIDHCLRKPLLYAKWSSDTWNSAKINVSLLFLCLLESPNAATVPAGPLLSATLTVPSGCRLHGLLAWQTLKEPPRLGAVLPFPPQIKLQRLTENADQFPAFGLPNSHQSGKHQTEIVQEGSWMTWSTRFQRTFHILQTQGHIFKFLGLH